MREVIRQRAPRLILTFLLAAGLTFPFLGALHLQAPIAACLLLCVGEAVLLEILCVNRRILLYGSLGLGILILLWMIAGGGIAWLADLMRAFTLQISGIPGALQLVEREACLLLTALFTLLCFLCARQGAGSMGAMLLAAGSLLMLWLADRADLMIWLLPGAIAAICLMLMERHQELSLGRALPWVAAMTLLAYGLTPGNGVEIPALKDRMDALRQSLMDRLFFTEPRDVFSLSVEGFYPEGISQLGGPVQPSDHRVMQVSTPRTTYLRGVLMNEYDGRAWRNTLGGRRYLWDAGGLTEQRAQLFDQNRPAENLRTSLTEHAQVSVRMLGDGASTLFTPQRVRSLQTGGELVPYYTNSSELFVTRNLREGDTWSVSAPLFLAGDPGLGTIVDAAARGEDAQWEQIRETYTALPGHLEEPVWQLAADVTAGLDSEYDKALALQNHLSRNYRYTLEPPWQAGNVDFVTSFLFQTQEGYCTYFASAMTVLCRMAGLPARYVEGYLAEPNAQGEALVTGRNAHAWTEVYFRGFGWLTFDATPREAGGTEQQTGGADGGDESERDPTEGENTPPEPEVTPEPQESTEEQPDEEPEEITLTAALEEGTPLEETGPEEENRPFPWGWLILILLLALAGSLWIRWILTSPARRDRRAETEEERFDLWMEEVLFRLAAAGHTRRTGETMMAFTRRLDATNQLPARLGELGECASLLRYGRVNALPTDTDVARKAAAELKRGMDRKARARYAVNRLLGAIGQK